MAARAHSWAVYAHLDLDLSGTQTGTNGRHPCPRRTPLHAHCNAGVQPETLVVAYDDAGGMFCCPPVVDVEALVGPCECGGAGRRMVRLAAGSGPNRSGNNNPQAPCRIAHTAHRAPPDQSPYAQAPVTMRRGVDLFADRRPTATDRRPRPRPVPRPNETLDPVGGHIPGALNRFFKLNLTESGCFQTASTLREEFTALLDGRLGQTPSFTNVARRDRLPQPAGHGPRRPAGLAPVRRIVERMVRNPDRPMTQG